MKCKHISLILAAALALGLASCSKNESATLAADDANKAAEAAKVETAKAAEAARAEAAKAEAAKAAEAAKVEAARVEAANAEAAKVEAAKVEAAKVEAAKVEAAKVEAAKVEAAKVEAAKVEAAKVEAAKLEAAKAADNIKTQELIDKAKGLVAENKFADASSVLQELAGRSLSGDQAKLVDELKQQIQKALVAQAAGNAGNLVK